MATDFEIADIADQQSIVFVTIFKILSYLADIATDTATGITYCKVNYCELPKLWNYDSDEVNFPTRSTTAISLIRNVNETSKNDFRDKAPVYGFVTLGLLWLPGNCSIPSVGNQLPFPDYTIEQFFELQESCFSPTSYIWLRK